MIITFVDIGKAKVVDAATHTVKVQTGFGDELFKIVEIENNQLELEGDSEILAGMLPLELLEYLGSRQTCPCCGRH